MSPLERSRSSTEPLDSSRLRSGVTSTDEWLFDVALPFWSTSGLDGEFGFAEHLTLDGICADVAYKRTRVQARQVYVFCHAALLGFDDGLRVAEQGWRFLEAHALRPGGGWVRRSGRYGGVTDPTLDLYDQAFGMFAAAWWFRATGDELAIVRAQEAFAAIDRELATPGEPGWLSESGRAGERLQNPHMHLLEAAIALHECTGDPEFGQRVAELVDLYQSSLFDPATGTLVEYFGADWSRLPGDRGRVVEPGHHYEWTWLLHHAEAIVSGASDTAGQLFEFAVRHGNGARPGSVIDEVLDDGTPRARGTRAWQPAEAIKASVARIEYTDEPASNDLMDRVDELRGQFLDKPVRGAWIDQLDAQGQSLSDKIPSSTLYHVFMALTELHRVPQILAAKTP